MIDVVSSSYDLILTSAPAYTHGLGVKILSGFTDGNRCKLHAQMATRSDIEANMLHEAKIKIYLRNYKIKIDRSFVRDEKCIFYNIQRHNNHEHTAYSCVCI